LARRSSYKTLPFQDREGADFKYAVPDLALRLLHRVDRDAGGAIKGSDQITSPHTRDTYILKSLIEEAITSSQLEGAATTREVAKEMLREGRQPLDRSERMIYNNYLAMQFIRDLGKQPLTRSIILELQRVLTDQTLDDPGAAGRLRRADEPIHVVDPVDGKTLHLPPPAADLDRRLGILCDFANGMELESFVHPVTRAILLHFVLAYDHPFVDGNGRTARALFYWSMRIQGYWLSEFISISSILRQAPAQYARAFLYTESDDNDVTYFVAYQLRVLVRAIERLHLYLLRKSKELQETQLFLQQSKLLRATLNHRQLALINHALKNPGFVYTIESHRGSHGISYQTARTDLLHLSEIGLLGKGKAKRAFLFMASGDLHDRIRGLQPSVGA
jgi:Fic family protein